MSRCGFANYYRQFVKRHVPRSAWFQREADQRDTLVAMTPVKHELGDVGRRFCWTETMLLPKHRATPAVPMGPMGEGIISG